jgi:hypothetical protein
MDRLSFKSQGVRRRYDLLLLTILESFTAEGLFLFVFAKDIICTLTLVALQVICWPFLFPGVMVSDSVRFLHSLISYAIGIRRQFGA